MDTATPLSQDAPGVAPSQLKSLVPLNTLPDDALGELLQQAAFEMVARGGQLFDQGDTNHEHVYLLEGTVVLLSDQTVVERVTAKSETARFPLAHQLPRKHGVRAETETRIVRIDSRLLSDALARTQTEDYKVADLNDASEDDWMTMLLQSRVLQQVPASNIQRVMMNVEEVGVTRHQDLIRQGDPGDYYYMLTRGRAVVRRDVGDGKGATELATLGPGDAFGEEALLSDQPRNSTVTMLQDGAVLRLAKEHFINLIHNPLLDRIDRDGADAKIANGAIWLDLRSAEQYEVMHLPGAINFPFESLRYQALSLAPDCHYVLYSNSGGRAMAGAFLLTERGFDVSVLEGGLVTETPAPKPAAEVPTAAAPPSEEPVAAPDVEEAASDERIRDAELRARELEQRLQELEAGKQNIEAERQQDLQKVRLAVDQARRKLIATEEQKREALAARQQTYAEMERLTGNLELVESERASLQERMAEIEGLDKQLQLRLAKAERELIGERERAESATSSLEELSERLSEVLDQREQERQQNALEHGELKEEITALQLDLEQSRLDLEDATGRLARLNAEGNGDAEALAAARQKLEASEASVGELKAERDTLRSQLEQAQAGLEGLGETQTKVAELEQALDEARTAGDREAAESARVLANERAEFEAQTARHTEALSDAHALRDGLQHELDQIRAESEALRAESERLSDDQAGQIDTLRAEVERLAAAEQTAVAAAEATREEHAETLERVSGEAAAKLSDVEAELEAVAQQTAADLAQARAAVADLEQRLAEQRDEAEQRAARDLASVQGLEAERDKQAQENAALRADLTRLQADSESDREERAAETEQAATTLTQLRARNSELNAALAEQRDSARLAAEQAQEALAAVGEELRAARDALVATEARAAEQAQAAASHLEEATASAARAALTATTERERLQAELDRSLAEQDALRQASTSTEADMAEALEQAASRLRQSEEDLAVSNSKLEMAEQAQQQASEDAQRAVADLRAEMAQLAQGADAAAARANDRIGELEDQLGASQAAAKAEQEQLSEAADAAARQLETMRDEATGREQLATEAAQQALAEIQAELVEARSSLDAATAENGTLRAELEQARTAADEVRDGNEEQQADAASVAQQLRGEIQELSHRLEERETLLAAARAEQAELINALNSAGADRETLQLALGDQDEQQAELEALKSELDALQRQQEHDHRVHGEQLSELRAELDEARSGGGDSGGTGGAQSAGTADAGNGSDDVLVAQLREQLAAREGEVKQLRAVLEEYVGEIRGLQQGQAEGDELAALRAELEMVREQAVQDVAQMREQLAAVETRGHRQGQAVEEDAVALEAMRQQIASLESSVAERQRDLKAAQAAQGMLEDTLEDTHRQLDEARRELEKSHIDAEQAEIDRREAEHGREQLQDEFDRLQESVADEQQIDLRDDRLRPGGKALGMDTLKPPKRWPAALLGASAVLIALEGVSLGTGNGEFFALLMTLVGG